MSAKNLQSDKEADVEQTTVSPEPSEKWIEGAISEGAYMIPDELRDRENWICYRMEERNGSMSKVPKRPYMWKGTIYNTSVQNLEEAGTHDEAMSTVKKSNEIHGDEESLDGVGVILHEENNLIGLDFDYALESTGEGGMYDIKQWALETIFAADSYTEISPSSSGAHILATGELLDMYEIKADFGIEIYEENRFFTFTGRAVRGVSRGVNERTEVFQDVQRAWIPEKEDTVDDDGGETSDREYDEYNIPDDELPELTQADRVLIERGCKADEDFKSLWEGDLSVNGYDHSKADLNFACKLAWRSRSDLEQMIRIFKNSGLMRQKWYSADCPENYGIWTLKHAIKKNGR